MIRPLQGRAFVEILPDRESVIIDPEYNRHAEWEKTSHRGRVLLLGKPAETERRFDGERWVGGAVMPWGCKEGDTIQFVLAVWLDKMRRGKRWPEFPDVKGEIVVLAQAEVLAVWE